ncbi:MAG: peptidoglycan DD-metalloendopeptidase family protein, partial [Pseudomonadota bacterium]
RREFNGQGGLFLPPEEIEALSRRDDEVGRIAPLISDLERVNLMRIAVDRLPFARPVRGARLTSSFGTRRDPFNGRKAHHSGVDYAGPRGTPIYATAAGEVVKAGVMRGYGRIIKIKHAFGYETVYAHLHRIRVKVGDVVERGDRIGDMGNTGRSTGTHLHYEVRIHGKAVNPARYIEAARHVL